MFEMVLLSIPISCNFKTPFSDLVGSNNDSLLIVPFTSSKISSQLPPLVEINARLPVSNFKALEDVL